MGASAGIGGTYAAMPELFLKANEYVSTGNFEAAGKIQSTINDIIVKLCSYEGHMYAVIKEVLKRKGVNVGSVRGPLQGISDTDAAQIDDVIKMIDDAIACYC